MSGGGGPIDPTSLHERLVDDLFLYYRTQFGLRFAEIEEEREDLLRQPGRIYQEPLLEPRISYRTTGRSFLEDIEAIGLSPDLHEFALLGLWEKDWQLMEHQRDALALSTSGKHVVVSAGTGSGKTESFLLPVVANLLQESERWDPPQARGAGWRWWRGDGPYVNSRTHESRPAAVRTMVLYPMNALVEDQLRRLRQALDGPDPRSWLDANRSSNRFYFGRYTGRTPGSGRTRKPQNLDELRAELRNLDRRAERVVEQVDAGELKWDARYFLPQLDGAEMISRWDMQDTPPDILITNYSMLNIMLMRHRDADIFAATKQWLEADDRNTFTLVVDELHMYRGTAGTEVAYMLRNLIERIGLRNKPDQLRILAASASLGDGEDVKAYLERFFAQPAARFTPPLTGSLDLPTPPSSRIAVEELEAAVTSAKESTTEMAGRLAIGDRAVDACVEGTTVVARSAAEIVEKLTQDVATEDARLGLLALLAAQRNRFRAHFFFRNVPGMWACSDPQCPEVSERYRSDSRPVGKLFDRPQLRCSCGARVLDLLYCQNCGDLFLGGYEVPDPDGDVGTRYLVPDQPDLEGLPNALRVEKTLDNYACYWPQMIEPVEQSWTATNAGGGGLAAGQPNQFTFRFVQAALDPRLGRVSSAQGTTTGWLFTGEGDVPIPDPRFQPPATPTRCPRCGADWERWKTRRPVHDPQRSASPVRFQGTGHSLVTQVLADTLSRSLRHDRRKLVAFSDSRRDAAVLSSNISNRQYLHVLRQVLVRASTKANGSSDVDDALRALAGSTDEQARSALDRVKSENSEALVEIMLGQGKEEGTPERERADLAIESMRGGDPTVRILAERASEELLGIGLNPAGPAPSRKSSGRPHHLLWTSLVDWEVRPPRWRQFPMGSAERAFKDDLMRQLQVEINQMLASGRGNDLESMGVRYLAVPAASALNEVIKQVAPGLNTTSFLASVLRVYLLTRKVKDLYPNMFGSREPPPKVERYVSAIAAKHAVDPAALLKAAVDGLEAEGILHGHLLDPEHLIVQEPDGYWVCSRCRTVHLHASNGICVDCTNELPSERSSANAIPDNYFRHLAQAGEELYAMRTEELTGQTPTLESQSRQARFQGVFLDDEVPAADDIQLLSVTTTMEAGVDIGTLDAVVMANMPPMRFNYQQRVGRAGRRDEPLSIALTVCRQRSHDDYYFGRADRITSDPPPEPYLDTGRVEILRRALAAELLRRAFRSIAEKRGKSFDPGDETHGEFGPTSEWSRHRSDVQGWLDSNRSDVAEVVSYLTANAELDSQREALEDWAFTQLVPMVDDIVADETRVEPNLSKGLAYEGVLPMFGFPTRVRELYTEEPASRSDDSRTIDRDLKIAISEWAPGAEVVRDKLLHRIVGVAGYQPRGPKMFSLPDPLGPRTLVGLCASCQSITTKNADLEMACPVCQARRGDQFEVPELREPLGFRTDWRPADYRDQMAYAPRASQARISTEHANELRPMGGQLGEGLATQMRVYTINDNRGFGYRFLPEAAGKGWIALDLPTPTSLDAGPTPATRTQAPVECHLASIEMTDVLMLGIDPAQLPSGVTLSPANASVRAAWFSLAFLLRVVAADLLDIDEQELQAGIRSVRHRASDREPVGQIFIGDTLANGAGYSTHLGDPDVFNRLITGAREVLTTWGETGHPCDSACYDCLKDYWNLPFHGLLDWRLAGDLLDLMTAGRFDGNARWRGLGDQAVGDLIEGFEGLERRAFAERLTVARTDGSRIIVPRHPLEDPDKDHLSEDLAEVVASAVADGTPLENVHLERSTIFDLLRRPAWVMQGAYAQGA